MSRADGDFAAPPVLVPFNSAGASTRHPVLYINRAAPIPALFEEMQMRLSMVYKLADALASGDPDKSIDCVPAVANVVAHLTSEANDILSHLYPTLWTAHKDSQARAARTDAIARDMVEASQRHAQECAEQASRQPPKRKAKPRKKTSAGPVMKPSAKAGRSTEAKAKRKPATAFVGGVR